MRHGLVKQPSYEASAVAPVQQQPRVQHERSCTDLHHLHEAAFTYYQRLGAVAEYARAHLYARDHLKEPLKLATVADVAGLERKYFSAYFRAKTGVTWTDWLRFLRVSRAKELIAAREVSITRLAFESGFGDVRTFERAFKRVVGVPPAIYRAAVRPESRRST